MYLFWNKSVLACNLICNRYWDRVDRELSVVFRISEESAHNVGHVTMLQLCPPLQSSVSDNHENIIWRLVELTVEVSGHSSQKLIKMKNAWKRHLVANFQKSWKWDKLIFLLCPVSHKNILLWHESRKKLRCQFPPLDVNTVD